MNPEDHGPLTYWARATSHDLATKAVELGSKVRHFVATDAIAQKLPETWGEDQFRVDLLDLIPDAAHEQINAETELSFHLVGDTGGHRSHFHLADRFLHPQDLVAHYMAADATNAPKVACFFHLGDVVYPHGERAEYASQFYEPYRFYPPPIVAIPGNHDATPKPGSGEDSLQGFIDHFCTRSPTEIGAGEWRLTQTQPNVYFT
jgi:hypothetical protein